EDGRRGEAAHRRRAPLLLPRLPRRRDRLPLAGLAGLGLAVTATTQLLHPLDHAFVFSSPPDRDPAIFRVCSCRAFTMRRQAWGTFCTSTISSPTSAFTFPAAPWSPYRRLTTRPLTATGKNAAFVPGRLPTCSRKRWFSSSGPKRPMKTLLSRVTVRKTDGG